MSTPQHATDELVAYVVAERPTWEPWAVRTAIAEALTAGWTWRRIVSELVRLLWDDDAMPGDLVDAAPSGAGQVLPRDRVAQYAAAARAALAKGGGT